MQHKGDLIVTDHQQTSGQITSKEPGVAAIQFALRTDDGMRFLRMFDERDFDAIRREWPDAPTTIFGGV
ncbi:hypothetical protein OOJ96_18125 [Pseudomonas sp. 15FMM2]|uniref:Uncharacterized protein n=1 Tax=Pseudomonas imrae TaxID=2992837 RepID=A0ACC7PIB0_9PSED